MTNEWLVPILVALVVGGIVVWQRRSPVPRSRRGRRPTKRDSVIASIQEQLGIGIIVHEVEAGPPVRIMATGLLDGQSTSLAGVGTTEDEAWDDLARAALAWKRDDPRNIRTYLGGA